MEKWMKNFLILLTIDSKQLNLEVLFYLLILFVELYRLQAVARKNAKQHEHVNLACKATGCHLFCFSPRIFKQNRDCFLSSWTIINSILLRYV